MAIAQVRFTPWDKIYNFNTNNLDIKEGDKVIVRTEMGTEIGEVLAVVNSLKDCIFKDEKSKEEIQNLELKPILRKATKIDLDKLPSIEEREEALLVCKKFIQKHNLPMKLVDVHFSFDGSRITFAFIADGRVDFRELVKDLTRHFCRTIRLHQIGIRDEARIKGDCGHCGRILCCRSFLRDLVSITSEMSELQQCSHRGSERISGVCGRLMCCLAYEEEGYKELAKNMPSIGAKVNVDGKSGVVVGHHILKQSVDVEFPADNGDGSTVVEVDLNRHKKKKFFK